MLFVDVPGAEIIRAAVMSGSVRCQVPGDNSLINQSVAPASAPYGEAGAALTAN